METGAKIYSAIDDQLPPAGSGLKTWPAKNVGDPMHYDQALPWPKISIVTPSFNQGRYIEETIRSVLLQNYPNLEYIIIDGGSSDETTEIIKKYEPWITYWVSEKDNGQSHAINKGLAKCSGEIFNWLNSDDWYMPDTFFEVATAFMRQKDLQFVSGYENHIGMDGGIFMWTGTVVQPTLAQTIEVCEVTQPSTFFKLDAIRKTGGVPEDMHYIMDGEMWVKLLLRYGQKHFVKIDKVLVNFRLHADSKTVSNSLINNFLYERSSIITDLQRFVGVPEKIITYYIEKIYKSPKVYALNRDWQIDPKVISPRELRLYFIRKYLVKQAIESNRSNLWWGSKLLIRNGAIDIFLLKTMIKALLKKPDPSLPHQNND